MKKITIDPLSATSLRLESKVGNLVVSSATGFVVLVDGAHFLITNWHVVTGRNADTHTFLDKRQAIPDSMFVYFHAKGDLNRLEKIDLPLFDEFGNKCWLEHPRGSEIDVVALRLQVTDNVDVYPLDLKLASVDVIATPAMPVSILGYPFGLSSGGKWPIWKTGHIASDPDLDYKDGKPAFLIDATTKSGMSGGPVILRLNGGFAQSDGSYISMGNATKFLGIYAGRIHIDSDIGRVWRPFLIEEIVRQEVAAEELSEGDDECVINDMWYLK